MKTELKTLNEKLLVVTSNAQKVKIVRATIVNDIITLVINEAKNEHLTFSNKRLAQKWIILQLLNDEKIEADTFTKRALTLSKKILVDGYTIKKELLPLAMAEALCNATKPNVNALMSLEDNDDYLNACKNLITITKKQSAYKKVVELKLLSKMEALQALNLSTTELSLILRAL